MTRLRPSFLICSERSGSNLIRSILNAHPQIYAPEPIHLGAFWERVRDFGDLRDDGRWLALLTAIVEFERGWKGKLDPQIEFTVDELLAALSGPREFASIYECIYGRGLERSGKRHLFVKENHTAQRAVKFLHAYPEAKFLWQARDPRDFLASCKRMPAYKYGSAAAAVETWVADQEAALRLEARLGRDRVLRTTYEDLLDDPEAHLRRVCAFLGVEFAAQMLAFHETEDARRSATHPAWRNLGRPIMRGNAGHYAQTLTRLEIALVESRAAHLMTQLGYGDPRPRFRRAQRLATSLYAAVESRLRRGSDESGSVAVHRVIDRYALE